ncbi:hemerythrin family protein [Sulfurimonas sp. SAG-AH-194-I05]|nr:hemerythrin family protein [Sulfurimonas sp. SAG-AH-194-I05]MDF1875081.1 hemerythrin family protein [Sulfurimonas sp. SAG-AH-194-I05]
MITQDQLPMVAMPSMNDTHLEDILIINKLSKAAQNKDFDGTKGMLKELIEHTIVHFSGEEEMMREKNFPPYPIHKAEHDRVLNELTSVAKNFEEGEGDFLLITAYVDGSLAPWLVHHIETLDTVTAAFLQTS